jgi:hypothetical protein
MYPLRHTIIASRSLVGNMGPDSIVQNGDVMARQPMLFAMNGLV